MVWCRRMYKSSLDVFFSPLDSYDKNHLSDLVYWSTSPCLWTSSCSHLCTQAQRRHANLNLGLVGVSYGLEDHLWVPSSDAKGGKKKECCPPGFLAVDPLPKRIVMCLSLYIQRWLWSTDVINTLGRGISIQEWARNALVMRSLGKKPTWTDAGKHADITLLDCTRPIIFPSVKYFLIFLSFHSVNLNRNPPSSLARLDMANFFFF